nr:hypothetical protein [Sicyoidochytrium minutum DNA virus]
MIFNGCKSETKSLKFTTFFP